MEELGIGFLPVEELGIGMEELGIRFLSAEWSRSNRDTSECSLLRGTEVGLRPTEVMGESCCSTPSKTPNQRECCEGLSAMVFFHAFLAIQAQFISHR